MKTIFLIPFFLFSLNSNAFEENPLKPVKLDNPRDTMRTFMEAMNEYREGIKKSKDSKISSINDAIRTLDLSEISSLLREETGKQTAILLKEVIDRVIVIDYNKIPETNPDGSAIQRWRLKGTEITIVPSKIEGREGEYVFSKDTVKHTPLYFSKVKDLPFKEGSGMGAAYSEPTFDRLVPSWAKETFIAIAIWQWIGLGLSILLGLILRTLTALAVDALEAITSKTASDWDDKIIKAIDKPIGLVVACGFWFFSLYFLKFEGFLLSTLTFVVQVTLSFAVILVVYRILDVAMEFLSEWTKRSDVSIDDQFVHLLHRSLRIFIWIFGILVALQNLGVNVMSVLAGLGLGGLAFALAAKDTCANFFGSIMIFLDRPFRIGDWIVGNGVEGTVEDIGFRSTRVRTFYNSLISVPNASLSTTNIDNMGQREYRRMKVTFGLTYDTPPEKIEAFLEGVKGIIQASPYTNKDNFHIVFNNMGSSSLDMLLYCFLKVPDWGIELLAKQNILLEVVTLAKKLEVSFAFPTQSLHLESDPEHPLSPHDPVTNEELKKLSQEFSPKGMSSKPYGKGVFTPPYKSIHSEGSNSE